MRGFYASRKCNPNRLHYNFATYLGCVIISELDVLQGGVSVFVVKIAHELLLVYAYSLFTGGAM